MTRMFFSVDAHGSTVVWRKWVSVPSFHNADMLLLCGDLTGKALVPLIEQKDGKYSTHYFGRKWTLSTEQEVEDMEKRLADSGTYAFKTTNDEIAEMRGDRDLVDKKIEEAICNRLREWFDLLLEKVDPEKVQLMAMPGNDDEFYVDSVIKEYEDKGIIWCLDEPVDIGGFECISYAHVNPTPWNTDREKPEEELRKDIDNLVDKLDNVEKSIFNFHAPPYGTRLDLAPKLKNLKVQTTGGEVEMEHVGSKAVYEAEKEYQPMIGLHGHIHESYASEVIGNTPVVNPGSEYGEGILRGFIIELDENGVDKYWKVEG
ncbi:MAG: phosphoesterase [Euryarchaeota archaeon]|nr:phosphoesterase [Euryarchaeota archaeon]